jgi:hypothetical protein
MRPDIDLLKSDTESQGYAEAQYVSHISLVFLVFFTSWNGVSYYAHSCAKGFEADYTIRG